MRWFIETVRNRDEEHCTYVGSFAVPDNREDAIFVLECYMRVFPHRGYDEEHDFWWGWDDDEPNRVHRWVLRDKVTDPY